MTGLHRTLSLGGQGEKIAIVGMRGESTRRNGKSGSDQHWGRQNYAEGVKKEKRKEGELGSGAR